MRIPKSYIFTVNGIRLKAETLLMSRKQCRLDGVSAIGLHKLGVAMKRVKDKNGNDEYLTVLTNSVSFLALQTYTKRWCIETMFQDFKGQGFRLESTHLQEHERIVKLLYLVSLAYVFCIHAGMLVETQAESVKFKNHGWRSYSVFRKGVDKLRDIFGNKRSRTDEDWHDLVERFIHWSLIKMLRYG